ncbi:MAG: glycine--tRNA ligase subunit beta [Armatimonadetes bacterium]|nr:glycine--tRNA ligase subunit beta [Armatimonadota bacterium]
MPRTLLLEIGTEEMPARFMVPALEQLRELIDETLTQLRLEHGQIRSIGTPRRLTAIVSDVADTQIPIVREIRGPAKHIAFDHEGNPTKAAEGFAKAQGVAVSDLVVKATDKGEFVFAIKREEGKPATEVLAEALPQIVRSLSFPKTMRWEESGLRFGRPIRWIVALLGDEVIPFEIAGVKSDRVTYGRRFTNGQSIGRRIVLNSADDYESFLKDAYVIVDHEKRRELVRAQVQSVAQSLGGVALISEELLDEVTFLVEEPVALVGHFDERYLELPAELLITVMQHHQRYFPVARGVERGASGELMPHFIFVSNGMPKNPDLVRQGNEKVVTARFEDARFYFAEDRKHKLEDFVPKLNEIVFIEGLGTVADKTDRLKKLSTALYGGLSPTLIRAAELCKADLATRLVNEFTELQGVIGRVYALLDGEPVEVAEAIEDHYKPLPPDFELPRNEMGFWLAVADRLDTLCACFDRDLIPTGSHDPFGLRRAATTLLLLMRKAPRKVSLSECIDAALKILSDAGMTQREGTETKGQLLDFLRERLDGLLELEGIDHDIRQAVLAVGFDDVAAAFERGKTLQRLRNDQSEWFSATVIAFTRITNILAQARQRGETVDGEVEPELLQIGAERELHELADQIAPKFTAEVQRDDFLSAFETLSTLVPTINRFFDEVLVMHEDAKIRRNRLVLLKRIETLLLSIADFRLVQT